MRGKLRGAKKSVQDLNIKHFNFFFCGHATYRPLSRATFDGPPAEREQLGPLTGPLFKLPSLVQGDVIVANGSRQKRDSVNQTPPEESAGTPSQ